MLSTLNLETLFSEALSRHLSVVHQLDTQRQRLEEIAGRITKALLDGNKIRAAATVARHHLRRG